MFTDTWYNGVICGCIVMFGACTILYYLVTRKWLGMIEHLQDVIDSQQDIINKYSTHI